MPVVDRPRLEHLVARVLGRPAGVTDWQGHAVYGGYGAASGGVYRFRGHARAGGGDGPLPWSLVLKVVRPSPRASEAPARWGYWKREALAYRSGLLTEVPGGLAAPRCYGVDERDGAAWLWLEDLTDAAGAVWPLARFGDATRHLGAFHGAYLTARPLPAAPWRCRDWLRTWVGLFAGGLERLAAARDDAAVRRYWPGDVYDRALRLWGKREAFLAALERVTQTVGRGDYKRPTLFARTRAGRARPWPSTGRTWGSRPSASTWPAWWRGAASSSPPSRRPCRSSTARRGRTTRTGFAGYVTRFRVRAAFLAPYPVRTVGAAQHQEYWIPAGDLAAFNAALVGPIEVVGEFRGRAPASA